MTDLDGLIAALEAKRTEGHCPSCGQRPRWSYAQTMLADASYEDRVVSADTGIHALVLICTNCGFIRLHDSKVLDS